MIQTDLYLFDISPTPSLPFLAEWKLRPKLTDVEVDPGTPGEEILERFHGKNLRLAAAKFPPFVYGGIRPGELEGLDIEIWKVVADDLGMERSSVVEVRGHPATLSKVSYDCCNFIGHTRECPSKTCMQTIPHVCATVFMAISRRFARARPASR